MKKLALLLVLMLCLSSVCALAEVKRGDHGEEVRYLQWLLQQTGWLSDTPDGSFGPRTEQAVIDYQNAKGHEATGVADDALMLELDEDRVRHDQELYGSDYYQPYPGNYEPAMVADYGAPPHCRTTVLQDILYRDSCPEHLELLEQEYNLAALGDAASYAQASELWRKELNAQFDAWRDSAPQARQSGIEAAREAWDACFQAQYGALNATLQDPATVERQLALMLKNFTGTLCEFLSGDMPATPAEDYVPATDSASTEPYCVQWSINAGTEFFTGCAAHAPLFAREYEWTRSGASDAAGLNALRSDWDAALMAMYDLWAEKYGGDAVPAAREACRQALDALDGALSGDSLAALAHVRAVQLECARLCELLKGH